MARYRSTITDKGSEVLTNLIAIGSQLQITRAACGDGIPEVSPNTLTALVSPITVDTQVQAKQFIPGDPSIMKIPVQVTNAGLESEVWVREIGIFALDENNQEFLFAYSWLDGEDSDNVLPATSFLEDPDSPADTVHIHDVALLVTNQENSNITIQVGASSFVTTAQMIAYSAPLVHTQPAGTVIESTGQTVEETQRRQDFDIEALKEQLDTGFVGTTVTHTFAPSQLPYWKGYDGTGLPEGVLDTASNKLYL